jgi:two-component system nitrate/nitrite response regulator NarL
MTSILIADKQYFFALGLQTMLETVSKLYKISIADNNDDLQDIINEQKTDILIIDFECVDGFFYKDLSVLQTKYPHLQILVVTACKDKSVVAYTLDIGIHCFIMKSNNAHVFIEAFNACMQGDMYIDKTIQNILIRRKTIRKTQSQTHITNKELEIIRMLSQGLTTKQIAEKLFISIHTVNTHRKNILQKLGLKNTSELLMYVVRHGIIDTIEYHI